MIGAAVVLLISIMLLYPKMVEMLEKMQRGTVPATPQEQVEEFNPYAPITIVPNDYQEGQD